METSKHNKGTYITSFEPRAKIQQINNILNNQKKLSSPHKNTVFKTIQNSPSMHNKKLKSLIFPSIKPHPKNIISIFFDSGHRRKNKIQKKNLFQFTNKNNDKIDKIISKIKNHKNNNNNNNKYLNIKFNSNNINEITKKQRYNTINNSYTKKKNNEINKLHNVNSARSLKKLYINNIEFNHVIQKSRSNNIIRKKSFNNIDNSYSNKSLKINSSLRRNKRMLSNIESFLKKEKLLEGSKKQLYTYSLKQFSPRLLRRKCKNENNKKNINIYRNNRVEKGKFKTIIFKNKEIPYTDKIDLTKISTYLPPIVIGSRYSIPGKSVEEVKRQEFNEALNKMINEQNKIKYKNKLNLTKKEILKKMRNRNLQFCNIRINKTEKDVYSTKNSIINNYNILKLSLDEFDNWNSPENIDNLFE